jgi:glucoamylase
MNRQVKCVPAGGLLRIQASSAFLLHWSDDEWTTKHDTASTPTSIGIEYADIQVASSQSTPIRFTFYWPQQSQWQGEDFSVEIIQRTQSS